MHDILQVLRQEHRNITNLINTLEWQVAEFEKGNPPDFDVIQATVDYFLGFLDLYHHPKEDLIFTKLLERDAGIVKVLGNLSREHEELGARSRDFATSLHAVLNEREISRKAFAQRARRFIELQWQHIKMEETSFFPAAEKTLAAEDWANLKARMTTGDDPLFGDNVGAKFHNLHQMILKWQAQDETFAAIR